MEPELWAQDPFDGRIVAFPNGTSWRIEDKLSERYQTEVEPCEASAVYNCSQVAGPQIASQAILKLKMQILNECQLSLSEAERAKFATDKISSSTEDELYFLQLLTDLECSSSLKLISWSQEKQCESDDMSIPGGYIVYILMEKLPGITIKDRDFWEAYPLEKRDEIRSAFHDAVMEILGHRISHLDGGLRNLLWDEQQKKCFIIDYENCLDFECENFKDTPLEFYPQLYSLWGLAKPHRGGWPDW